MTNVQIKTNINNFSIINYEQTGTELSENKWRHVRAVLNSLIFIIRHQPSSLLTLMKILGDFFFHSNLHRSINNVSKFFHCAIFVVWYWNPFESRTIVCLCIECIGCSMLSCFLRTECSLTFPFIDPQITQMDAFIKYLIKTQWTWNW